MEPIFQGRSYMMKNLIFNQKCSTQYYKQEFLKRLKLPVIFYLTIVVQISNTLVVNKTIITNNS